MQGNLPAEGSQQPDQGTSAPARCYRCGAELPPEAMVCPRCGRRQVRLCYCGNYVPVTSPRCPYCGADWSLAFRVRRKSRSRKLNWKLLGAYTAAGALASIALAALTNSIVGGLAIRSLPPGQGGLPGSFTARLALAMQTVSRAFAYFGHRVARAGGGPGVAIAVVFSGALLGALFYLYRTGHLKLRLPFGRKKVKRRRRQGVY